MKIKSTFITLTAALLSFIVVNAQEIPIEYLSTQLAPNTSEYSKTILENEIAGITVEHITLIGGNEKKELLENGNKYIYLFIKGQGNAVGNKTNYEIVPETILLPNSVNEISIFPAKNDTLHFIKIASKLTEQDLLDLKEFPKENTEQIYYAKFIDCKPYTEPIKSPNTVSRTVLPNKYIPRIAMGTVETMGPDKVDPHEHGMLEQLFLGLTDNNVIVYADDSQIDFPAYSILHIPLGSSHSVEAKAGEKMYYMWMDFFMDKKGEEWLKTHNQIEEE
ncbi:cupin domain-containing protein [Lutibacter sp.]|uniref:cupin domain-containing protein n=1 Tax=Lutibacter sp. TaxID=1925666 RepID=UPI0035649177